ncbi:MAG: acyl-CoA thioesterase [Rubricella sp.]
MYPYLRLGLELFLAGRRAPLPLDGVHVSRHRCWPWDIDMFGEMNNGRILTISDLGRIPLARRTGLLPVLMKNRWALTMAGASVRYRRRIRPFATVELSSACIGRDDRFFYLLQTFRLPAQGNEAAASILYRSAILENGRMIPTQRVAEAMGAADWNPALPGWVSEWIAADTTRTWPPEV